MNMIFNKSLNLGDGLFEISQKERVWLSSTEAAQFLGLSENAVRILVCRGKVKFYKLGRRLRFLKSDLEKLLKKGN